MPIDFFKNGKEKIPLFVESMDDYPHLKIVKLKGRLDISIVQEVQAFLQNTKKKESRINKSVLLDLKHVAEVDSAAIAGFAGMVAARTGAVLRRSASASGLSGPAANHRPARTAYRTIR